mgnify:CR=1 FL=1
MADQPHFKPFVPAETKMAEFTIKSIITGAIFGIIFGASTVYLALKAGLTVSASKIISFKQRVLPGKVLRREWCSPCRGFYS